MKHYDVVIAGAGLSGLVTAHRLYNKGIQNILVVDTAKRPGGVIQTLSEEGFLVEAGPTTFQGRSQRLLALCDSLNLMPLETASCAKYRYVFFQDKLCPVPMSPGAFISTPLLSPMGKLRLLSEPFQPAKKSKGDESIADFVKRRLGQEALDNLAAPFLTGVYAGDPEELSVNAVFGSLANIERESGSLIKGMLKRKPKNSAMPVSKYKKHSLFSFQNGLEELPKALAKSLSDEILKLGIGIQAITPIEEGYQIELTNDEQISCNSLVLATPPWVASSLTEPLDKVLSGFLSDIATVPLAVVHFGFEKNQLNHPLDGFGFLVSRSESQMPLLGSIWSSSLFPSRVNPGQALLTCFVGGALHQEILEWNDTKLLENTLRDLSNVLKQPGLKPTFHKIIRYQKAIPQYNLGHLDKIAAIQKRLDKKTPGLFLTGNYLDGVSLEACVIHGEKIAESSREYLLKLAGKKLAQGISSSSESF